jgi:hypothetical protein
MGRFKKIAGAAGLGAATLLVGTPAASHHSFAMFEAKKEITISGSVKNFQWTNPHSWLQLMVPGAAGQPAAEYSIEMGSPNTISRQGWRKTTFKPGDRVTVTIHPMRDGSPGGAFVSAKDSSGKELPAQ